MTTPKLSAGSKVVASAFVAPGLEPPDAAWGPGGTGLGSASGTPDPARSGRPCLGGSGWEPPGCFGRQVFNPNPKPQTPKPLNPTLPPIMEADTRMLQDYWRLFRKPVSTSMIVGKRVNSEPPNPTPQLPDPSPGKRGIPPGTPNQAPNLQFESQVC